MPLANLVQVFGNIGKSGALGMQKDTEPSSNAISTLVATKLSFEILRMITSLKVSELHLRRSRTLNHRLGKHSSKLDLGQ